MTCDREQTTQHYLGSGFGPVQPSEHVLYAVFDEMDYDSVNQRVTANSFNNRSLVSTELSLARGAYTTRSDFISYIVQPASNRAQQLVGVASARAAALFALAFLCVDSHPPLSGRAVCLIDLVDPQDHDGHAALGYSKAQETLTDKQKQKIRAKIRADIADVFSTIETIDLVDFCAEKPGTSP